MAEPARQLNDDDDQHLSATERAKRQWGMAPAGSDVEDPEDEKKSARERANDRWGMNDDEDLADKESSSGEGSGFYNPSDKEEQSAIKESGAAKSDATAGPAWVKGDKTSKNVARFVGSSFLKKKGLPIGAGAGGAIILIFIFFSFFSTYKVTHMLENIEQQVGQVPQYAVERRLEYYMNRYLILRQLAKAGVPEEDLDRYVHLGNGTFSTLYTNWKGANLDAVLENKYGMRIKPDIPIGKAFNRNLVQPRSWSIEIIDAGKAGSLVDVSSVEGQKLDSIFIRKLTNNFVEKETRSIQMVKRFNSRRIFKKYKGIDGWRQFAYDKSDKYKNASDRYTESKKNLRKKINDATIGRVSENWGNYMNCLVEGGTKAACKDLRKGKATSGESLVSESELTELTEEAGELAAKEAADVAEDEIEDLASRKLTEILGKFTTKKFLTSAVAGVGIVTTSAKVIQAVDKGALSQVVYVKNATQYAGFVAPILSGADQCKAGIELDSDDCGALSAIFKDYEKSKLYQQQQRKQKGLGLTDKRIKEDCNKDGDTDDPEDFVEENDPICENLKVMQDKESFTNTDAWKNVIAPAAKLVNEGPIGEIQNKFNAAIEAVTDFLKINDALQAAFEAIGLDKKFVEAFQFLIERISAPVVNGNVVGADAFDAAWAGMSSAQSSLGGGVGEAREDTIGGAYLSPTKVSQIKEEQYEERQDDLRREGVFARYFSPDVPESLTSQAIMATPSSVSVAASNFSSLLNPANLFGSTVSNFIANAKAQATDGTDPFGIISYGYPADSEVFEMEHDALDKKYQCSKPAADRPQNADSTYQQIDGVPFEVPTEVDPCLLEESVEDAGSRFFTKTYDEGIDDQGGAGTSTTQSGGGGIVTGEVKDLAQQILDNKNISFEYNDPYEFEQIAAGNNTAICGQNQKAVLGTILAIAKNHKIKVTSVAMYGRDQRDCGSPHGQGVAFDITNFDGATLTGNNEPSIALIKVIQGILGERKAGFGNCDGRTVAGAPAQFYYFPDNCNHVHTQIDTLD